MQIEAANLRLADAVRLAGDGEREIRKIEKNGTVRVWFRGDEEREQPSREFALGDVLEIQRPGDLFKAEPPPKTVNEARERIFKHMSALGWTVQRAQFGRVNDYVTDPSDTVRLKIKSQALGLQVRWNDNGRWPWNSNTRSLGPIKEFATKIEEQSAWLIRYARERAEKRFKSEAAAVAQVKPPDVGQPSAAPVAETPDTPAPVIVRYSYRDGVLLGGNTKQHKAAIKALRTPYRFRYSRNLPDDNAWYVQRTRDTHQPRERIELLAQALRRSGVPVVVEYTDPEATFEAERVVKETRRRDQLAHRDAAANKEQPATPQPRRPEPGEDDSIATARAGVARRRARSRALDDVARAAGIEVCPRAIFEIEPVPHDREQIKERAQAFSDLVHRYRELHQVELWAAGKIEDFPRDAALALNNGMPIPREIGDPLNAVHSVEWAFERYNGWVETVIDVMKPRDRAEATRVLDFCVRDIASGRRRAREGRPHARPAEPLDLLAYRGPGSSPAVQGTPAPAPRSRKAAAKPSPTIGRPPDNAKRAAKLRDLADKLEARANAELSADRLENTRRRADMAANIRERAQRQLVIAETMRRAADTVEAGELEYIPRISSQAQMEDLDLALRRAVWDRDRATGVVNRDKDREPVIEDIEHVEFPRVYGSRTAVVELLKDSEGLPNLAEARRQVTRYAKQPKDDIEFDVLDLWALSELIKAIKRDESRKLSYAGERTAEQIAVIDRLGRLGVANRQTLQAALREYLSCCRGKVQKGREDPAAVRKRELRFANIPGFFPTPRELAERLVTEAAIIPPGKGLRILEPSAGSGAIAEVIRKHHPDAKLDVIERQVSLREMLRSDGFNLVGDDFLAFEPSAPYDRIIMNPPFEKRQDTEHISRALDMIVPGGRLVAIASASLASRDDAATRKLRERIAELGGRLESLPAGSFKESGTDVHTVMVVADLPPAAKVERPVHNVATETALVELARAHGITPGESRTVGDRMKLIYEAEKRGWGSAMRTWLVKNRLIKPDWATEYGARARGRLAFERGEEWPPPPARGESYSAAEYAGLLSSLAHAPEAQAAVELGTQWTEGIKRIPGAARLYRNHDLAAQVRRALETRTDAAFDESKSPAAARARYERLKSALATLTRDMRLSLDSSLYDKSRDASQVYKTLCEISNDIAREALETIYGVGFVDRHDHYELCDGRQSLEDLGRKATQHAREEAQSKAKSNRERLADAKALLAVAADARSRGELTEKRFNLTYWRLHPEITGYKREDRRLQLTWFPGFRRTRGIAPQSSEKPTEAFVRGPSDHGFSTRVYRAGNEVAVVEALVEEIRREAAELERTVAREATSTSEPPKPPEHVTMVKQPSPDRAPDSDLAKRWASHDSKVDNLGLKRWANLEKTSCFVRTAGDVSVTLCPAIQKHAVGSCPPSDAGVKSRQKQLMLCQVDEDVEYFRGQTPGIMEAKAEAENRLVRDRKRRSEALGKLPEPAGDDFDAQERYLDALVPTRIVYRRSKPLDPIEVELAPPHVVTRDGKSTSIKIWTGPIPDDATLEVRVMAPDNQSLREFEAKLGEELIPYRGGIGRETLRKVLAPLYFGPELEQLVKAGVTLHDVQYGRFGGRSLYWLRSPDGSKTYGPITATGDRPSAAGLKEFVKTTRDEAQPLPTLPPGWTLDDTIVLALLVEGRHVWAAWQPSTGFGTTKGEGDEWAPPRRLPKRAEYNQPGGFDDFMHRAASTLWKQLERAPSSVRFRVAGPWLGTVFPSDYGNRVQFDPPTGGSLDIAQLEQEYAEYVELNAEHGDEDPLMLPRWMKVAPRRIAWAKKWLAAQRRAAKPKPATAKPKPVAKPKPATIKQEPATTVTSSAGVERREETDMSAKTGKKKTGAKKKAASKKKAAAKKPKVKKPEAKKPASKKAAAKKKTASKKPASKKTASKKTASKKTPTKKPESQPTAKVIPISAAVLNASPSQPAAEPKPPSRETTPDTATTRSLRFKRNDVVRFRKRSQIAAGLGVGLDKQFKVEMVTTDQGRTMVVLRVGQGKHSALIKVPPGHLAIVERGQEVPAEIRLCAARLSRFKGPITPKTRRLLAELAGRA